MEIRQKAKRLFDIGFAQSRSRIIIHCLMLIIKIAAVLLAFAYQQRPFFDELVINVGILCSTYNTSVRKFLVKLEYVFPFPVLCMCIDVYMCLFRIWLGTQGSLPFCLN